MARQNNGSAPITSFSATWTVPFKPPHPNEGQILFLFNAMEPSTGDSILQPVLQYGISAAGGGPYWAIANWYGVGNLFFHTTLQRVNSGQILTGEMKLAGISSDGHSYTSLFRGIGDRLTVTGAKQLQWATETFEVYNLQTTSELPLFWTLFWNIQLKTAAGYPNAVWSAVSSPTDGVTTKVLWQGSNGGIVQIIY
ncbi:hypothetical protein DL93DRAFT_1574998 [Clavulina sp. PMI_390]|nr:hypothetical protein DL93DRAFT_1574998 [Clavulina sp. PMI_390]